MLDTTKITTASLAVAALMFLAVPLAAQSSQQAAPTPAHPGIGIGPGRMQDKPAAQAPGAAPQESAGEQGCQQMMLERQEMMRGRHDMMQRRKEMDAKLSELVSEMNAATGSAKVDAMAKVINELVDQRAEAFGMSERGATMGMMRMPGAMMDRAGMGGGTCPCAKGSAKSSTEIPPGATP